MHISNKCSIAVHCLIFIHEFGESHKVTSDLLAMSSGCNPAVIRKILSALKKVRMISVKFGTGGAQLCCPPEEITLYRVCMCVDPDMLEKLFGVHQNPSPLCPVGKNINTVLSKSYDPIRLGLADSLKSVTLQDILEIYHDQI